MSASQWGRSLMRRVQQSNSGGSSGGGGAIGKLVAVIGGGILLTAGMYDSLFTVNGGYRAVMFNRFPLGPSSPAGVQKEVYGEGTHFRLPWLQYPTIMDIRTKPKTIRSPTGTKDLQMVDITLRILYKPDLGNLPKIYDELGTNYDERILPSIANETLKSVIAQFNASQLITLRDQVSALIRKNLSDRAEAFNILIDDVSITHLTFGSEYTAAVEAKQVAQQEAERAKYLVKQALQDKKSTIIKAEGEAKAAKMIGEAIASNPGYIELRQLDAASHISKVMATAQNKVILDSNSLLLNTTQLSESGKRLNVAK